MLQVRAGKPHLRVCRSDTWLHKKSSYSDVISPTSITGAPAKRLGFWKDIGNQRAFLQRIKADLGVQEYSDWYKVSAKDVVKRGGRGLLSYYPSLGVALQLLYPEYKWQLSSFLENAPTLPERRMPPGYWKSTTNLLLSLTDAEKRLGIQNPEDWYSVTISDLRELGFPPVGRPALIKLLIAKYPDYQWDETKLYRGKFLQQNRLAKTVMSLFPGREVRANVRKETQLVNPETGSYLELDIYIPSLQLAFEYQDIHHYKTVWWAHDVLARYQARDAMKVELAQQNGIALIVVPCWWDGQTESLVATIKQAQPSLLSDFNEGLATPIPALPPPEYLAQFQKTNIVDIGEPITATVLTRTDIDPTKWWMFEKYDGVRAFWNPIKKAFFSRQGTELAVPAEVIREMPQNLFLDGEFWFGRGRFEETMKIPRKTAIEELDWSSFKYMVFDIPVNIGTYEQRYSHLESALRGRPQKFIDLATPRVCQGIADLESFFQDVIDKGGEGVILRDPSSPYEPGRSRGYLKYKRFRDAEAKVTKCLGQNQWECQLPNGVLFTASAGTTEFVKRWNPQEGDIVTFKHRGFLLATKKPKLPLLYRLRADLSWEDVVSSWRESSPRKMIAKVSLAKRPPSQKPKGYWLNIVNRRDAFLKLATELGFNGNLAENWNAVKTVDLIAKQPNFRSLLKKYRYNLGDALKATFPDMDLAAVKERKKPSRYWADPQNCRKFFEEFAAENGFDPLDPECWHLKVPLHLMLDKKGGYNIKEQHGGFKKALQLAFPTLHLWSRWSRSGNIVAHM